MTNEELVQAYQGGDRQALEQLLEKNIGLVKFFCNKYCNVGKLGFLTFDDLEQESWMAFLDAADKYSTAALDNERKALFASYAGELIKWRILDSINDQVPRIKKSDINSDRVQFDSLDQPLQGADGLTVEESIADESAVAEFEEIEEKLDNESLRKDLIQLLEDVFNKSSDRQMLQVLYLHYGLGGLDVKRIVEIASIFNVTRQRVDQIESKALRRIRQSRPGKEFMNKYKIYFLEDIESRIEGTSPEWATIRKERYEKLSKRILSESG